MTLAIYPCTFSPRCSSRSEMTERHGNPIEFARATDAAFCDGFITMAEMHAANERYRRDWAAGTCTVAA